MDPNFSSLDQFTDVAMFTQYAAINFENDHNWQQLNPHVWHDHDNQQLIAINFCASH